MTRQEYKEKFEQYRAQYLNRFQLDVCDMCEELLNSDVPMRKAKRILELMKYEIETAESKLQNICQQSTTQQ